MKLESDNLSSLDKNLINLDFTDAIKRPLEVLAMSSAETKDCILKLSQIQTQNNDKAQKSFKKIAPKYQRMLLIASSVGDVIPNELGEDAMNFFGQSSVLNAQIFLNSWLENLKIEVSVSSAVTTVLQVGAFLWSDSVTPSGFACSVFNSLELTRPDLLHEGLVLDYSTKYEMSKSSLDKLTKTQVLFPKDIEGMLERIKALQAFSALFFGDISYLGQGLKKLINLCDSNKDVIRSKLFLDEKFIAKFLFMVDDRVYQWLKQCCRVESVSETNLQLMDFAQLFFDIQSNRFFCSLPSNIMKLSSNENENKNSKKRKHVEKFINNAMNSNWKLRNNESWDTIFKGKTKDGPMLSLGCKPCLKSHVKGICYSDCQNKASHCPIVNEEDIKKTDDFIKSLRGEL